jgi:hypothetical protein
MGGAGNSARVESPRDNITNRSRRECRRCKRDGDGQVERHSYRARRVTAVVRYVNISSSAVHSALPKPANSTR